MKHLIYILVLFFGMQTLFAQGIFSKERLKNRENHDKQTLRWGYYLGFNSLDYDFNYAEEHESRAPIEYQDIQTTKQVGFNVGLIGNLRINDHLDIRTEPGVIFNTRFLNFPLIEEGNNVREINTTAVHLPLLLKISTKRLNNFKPFVVGGVSTSINLSSNEKNPDDNLSGQFRTKTNFSSYEIGFGIDFFLPYFKFTPSVRGVFSMTDELVRDRDPDSEYTAEEFIDEMETRGIFINFTFQ